MKRHTLVALAFTLLVGISGLTQTTSDLQKKYGTPDASGRYTVRPGIGLTVQVDESGVTRHISIRPIEPDAVSSTKASPSVLVMDSDVAQAVLNEVAPLTKRGQYKHTAIARFGCVSEDIVDYENVLINISKRCSQRGGGTYAINIHWTK